MSVSLRDEVRGAKLGDHRLTIRLGKVIESLGAKPNMSVPAATHGRAEMEAAYRFFDNDKVSPERILKPHIEATRERVSQAEVALLVQDTTDLDLTRPKQQVRGAGPLEYHTRLGAFFHPLVAFNEHGLPLGIAWQKCWTRSKIKKMTTNEKGRWVRKTPIEEKETYRWIEGLRAAREVADTCPQTICVCIADSEADVYELYCEPRTTSSGEVHLLVRACKKRITVDTEVTWLEAARATKCLYQCSVNVSGRTTKRPTNKRKRHESREARLAELEVRATTVTVRPPYRAGRNRKLSDVTLNLVLAEESNPPNGVAPIQWLLATTLPIEEVQQVRQIIAYYCIRWQIEIYFRTLKSGCRIEDRQLETLERILNCLAVYAIIAWKVMYLSRLGSECPELSCELIFEPSEWKSVWMTIRKANPPSTPPPLNEMIRMIASLGGYVIRQSTRPGTQTLWFGLQRVYDLSTAWQTFGPD
ncbi:IS4 family transposase [Bythopirellula goksoeyrii]|uniref:Transposase for transposon Tn5 n=1 Tax=Bythopirellula goksoeyrii TaxID=1400387 RepID=A0A5B9QEB2_9BACT|nr:IS4 family transposase [Bythopirellula goksoeyrii]QEG35970.1 Transposase for transposon Tn5 [Bythopirellula goksoeyrii]QEG36125.1 Transposase for transposon Tn5 [Bythopirellula goksoeyrii]